MHRALLLAPILVSGIVVQAVVAPVPPTIFTDLGLTPQQIAAIDAGRPVAKVLSWGGPSEVQNGNRTFSNVDSPRGCELGDNHAKYVAPELGWR